LKILPAPQGTPSHVEATDTSSSQAFPTTYCANRGALVFYRAVLATMSRSGIPHRDSTDNGVL